jgi:hypothetical protein
VITAGHIANGATFSNAGRPLPRITRITRIMRGVPVGEVLLSAGNKIYR